MNSAENARQLQHARALQADWQRARLLGWTGVFDVAGLVLCTVAADACPWRFIAIRSLSKKTDGGYQVGEF